MNSQLLARFKRRLYLLWARPMRGEHALDLHDHRGVAMLVSGSSPLGTNRRVWWIRDKYWEAGR